MALTKKQKKKIEEEEKYRAQVKSKYTPVLASKASKNRIAAALLAIFLGGFGIHKFYLGRPIQGIIYFIFFWTFIPGQLLILFRYNR